MLGRRVPGPGGFASRGACPDDETRSQYPKSESSDLLTGHMNKNIASTAKYRDVLREIEPSGPQLLSSLAVKS